MLPDNENPNFVRRRPAKEVKNCAIEFRFQCPQDWEKMTATTEAAIRFCDVCRLKVVLCESDAAALTQAKLGHCVALRRHTGDGVRMLKVGMLKPSDEPSPDERAEQRAYILDEMKTEALRALKYSSRFCPQCGFPCPNWYEYCRVCHHPVGRIKPA